MALYEIVKPCQFLDGDHVIVANTTGHYVELDDEVACSLGDAVERRNLGEDDTPPVETEQPTSGDGSPAQVVADPPAEQPTPEPKPRRTKASEGDNG